MKLIDNRTILFSKYKRKGHPDLLFEKVEEIQEHFPNISEKELDRIHRIRTLYAMRDRKLYGFVEYYKSTFDDPQFTHVIEGDEFHIRVWKNKEYKNALRRINGTWRKHHN